MQHFSWQLGLDMHIYLTHCIVTCLQLFRWENIHHWDIMEP
jgi:hypothetical protein